MAKGMLVDIARCIGCRACQVACKRWNNNEGENTSLSQEWTNPPNLSAKTWTLIKFVETGSDQDFKWHFISKRCFHCLEPACVAACPVGALLKTVEGPVLYDQDKCIGCRYCMIACPFHIPKFQWNEPRPLIRKCTFCADRIIEGLEPACIQACPTNALEFGEREELIAMAKSRISSNPKYVKQIYGEHEVGGTSTLFVSDTPFENLGFDTNLVKIPIPSYTASSLEMVPYVIAGGAIILAGLSWYTKRREKIEREEGGKK